MRVPPRAQHLINVLTERGVTFEVEEDGNLFTVTFEDWTGGTADLYSATWNGRRFLYATSGWNESDGDDLDEGDEMSYNAVLSYARGADPNHIEDDEAVDS